MAMPNVFTAKTIIKSAEVNENFDYKATGAQVNTGTDNDRKVTPKAIADSYIPTLAPAGAIVDFGGSSAPTGWLLCDGSAISRTTYASLFTAISTTYGAGDGSTTFNVPNAKGRVSVMKSTDTEFDALGETGGAKTITLTAAQSGLPSHRHARFQNSGNNITGVSAGSGQGTGNTEYDGYTGGDSASEAHSNLQPYITFNKIIKY